MHTVIDVHTLRTTGNTHGFASSPRYAPTLRSTFWGKESLSQRSFRAKMASGGSSVTPCHSSGSGYVQLEHPHLEDMLHLPRGGAIAVDVDGRWPTICCSRAVAVAMGDAECVGGGEELSTQWNEGGLYMGYSCRTLRRVTTRSRRFWGHVLHKNACLTDKL